jgi:hypothetical protein
MKKVGVLITSTLLLCAYAIAQSGVPEAGANAMYFQQPLPADAGPPVAAPNVFFHAQKLGDNKMSTGYFAVSDAGNPVTGAPYSATAVTETTQVLTDGNRIVNKTESLLARDSQGRTRRQETMNNIGTLPMNGPKMAVIMDPVAKATYILDLNDQTAQVIKTPDGAPGSAVFVTGSGAGVGMGKQVASGVSTVNVQKRVMISDSAPGVEQRIWVDSSNDPSQVKTESLGTQVIEGVTAEGTRTTHTIPAGQIGNERPLEITSEVWRSPELQMVIMSKRNDPRFGETVYRLSDIKRVEPDPSLFQVPAGFSAKSIGN